MYIFKNALKSITRSKGRNILIGIIVLVMAVSCTLALTIRNSANQIVNTQKENFPITATIGLNRTALTQAAQSAQASGSNMMTTIQNLMQSIPPLTLSQVQNYGNSQYVKNYNYTLKTSVDSSNITAVSNNPSSSSNNGSSNSSANMSKGTFIVSGNQVMDGSQNRGDFSLVGYSSQASMTDFANGTYKITSGTMFSDGTTANDAVISDQLAQANNLSVGSAITLTNPQDTSETEQFTVVGIYTDTSGSDGSQMNLFSNAANQIITNYPAVNNMITATQANSSTELTGQLSSSFILNSADNVNPFAAQLTTKGLNKYYSVSSNVDSFNTSVAPLTNLSHFATIFLILVLAIGGIVLVVLNMINIRERKYEVGVLRAIGMKKGKVALQFITELFLVTFIALAIGSGIGAVSSVPTANYMLHNEITSLQSQQVQVQQNFGMRDGGQPVQIGGGSGNMGGRGGLNGFFGMKNSVSYVSQINAVINSQVLLQIAGIGILLAILSSAISMIFISRYEPLKILSSLS